MPPGRKDNRSNGRTVKVAEANSCDVGRKIGRLDPNIATDMGLTTGDAIEISSGSHKKTSVLHWPTYQEDYGKGLIRIDGYTMNKLEVGINNTVDIRKVETKEAQKITLAPT